MATRIKALASFSNQQELSHLDGAHITSGEATVVNHDYALELRSNGLVEILEENVDAESVEGTSTTDDVPTTSDETDSESSEEEGGQFSHTEFVAPDGSLTDELPKQSVLADRGVTTFGDLAEIADDFQQIKGIGPASEMDLDAAWEEIVAKT